MGKWEYAIGGFIGGCLVSFFLYRRPGGGRNLNSLFSLGKSLEEMKDVSSILREQHKMVLVVRTDLKMGPGKIAAQCCHATLECFTSSLKKKNYEALKTWKNQGQMKITLKVRSVEELKEIYHESLKRDLVTCIIADAGHTQILAGSHTVVGIGPAPSSIINEITGNLKLY
ncbi:hypothetical protein SNEBB_004580 [Seison nebaliae]|nr:hypothetical protein SNEBB_004580 [Seison nebaliae]